MSKIYLVPLFLLSIVILACFYMIIITIDTNNTILNREGWVYLGEGKATEGGYGVGVDCYGNPIHKTTPNKIGDIEVKADSVYTLSNYFWGWRTIPFAQQYTFQGMGAIGGIDKHNVFELYEKKYWFSSNYLVICK